MQKMAKLGMEPKYAALEVLLKMKKIINHDYSVELQTVKR